MSSVTRAGAGVLALAAALLAGPARAAEVEKLLPADTTLVLSLNVQQLLASPLVEKYAKGQIQQAMKADAETEKILKEIGLDPLTDFHRLTVALTAEHGPDKPLFIVRGKFNTSKINEKATQFSKDHADKLKVSTENGVAVYEIAGGAPNQTMFAALLDDTTLVAGNGKNIVTDAIGQAKGTRKGGPSKELTELIGSANDKQSVWLVILPKMFEKVPIPSPEVKKFLDQTTALTGNAELASDLKVEMGVVAKDADTAKSLAAQVDAGLDYAKSLLRILQANNPDLQVVVDLVGSLKSSTSGKTITVKGGLTEKQIEEQLKKAGLGGGSEKPKPPAEKKPPSE